LLYLIIKCIQIYNEFYYSNNVKINSIYGGVKHVNVNDIHIWIDRLHNEYIDCKWSWSTWSMGVIEIVFDVCEF
jgi:hypothetical protein